MSVEHINGAHVVGTLGLVSFSQALKHLKGGGSVARKGWNGKGMWLSFIEQYAVQTALPRQTRLLPWIGMKTADDGFVPWLASQTDLLAEDWELLK
jgi:hypothetical protein